MSRHGRNVSYLDRTEGDASTTDDEDLDDIMRAKKRKAEERLERDLASASSQSDHSSDLEITDPVDKPGTPLKAKVEWSDGEDDGNAYEKFINRKKRKRLTSDKSKRSAKKSKQAKATGRKKPEVRAPKEHAFESDDDEYIEAELPDYLKQRRARFERTREELSDAGLCLPPSYDDIDFSDDERLEELIERPDFENLKPCSPYKDIRLPNSLGIIPAPVGQWLRDYQVQGAAWLHELFVFQKGGILGDDMGLGKTIQVIAFLMAAFGKTGDERDIKRMRKMRRAPGRPWYPCVLIVCPGTLMSNWRSELAKWGWWNVDTFHGATADKQAALEAARSGRLEIMITTYDTYRDNKDAINMVEWDCVVADECHKIKEPNAAITEAMGKINALCRIGLSGTAIQNKYEELWTLLNWTNPGRLGSLSVWKSVISGPLRTGQSHDATVPELAKARVTARKLAFNLLPEFFLRRLKTLIADQLPKKSDQVVFCPMTDTQQEAYENLVASEKITAIRDSTQMCECDSGKKVGWCHGKHLSDGSRWQDHVFPCIMLLQKLSNHLATLIPSASDDGDAQLKSLHALEIAMPQQWKELYATRDSILNYANAEFCGKWKVLKKLLRLWYEQGDKVLVFSHSVRLLRMLQQLFASTTSYNVSYLDGSMSLLERTKAVDAYNADPGQFVFLISTKSGGVGLNITSANKVVVFDPNWNPAYDLQAQDRAYRIGQSRDVEVFRLVSAGTIEEIVYARQIYKQQQAAIGYTASKERRYFSGVQDAKDRKGEIFGLANLFAFQGDNVVLRQIVNKTNVAESRAGVTVVGLDTQSTAPEDEDDDGAQQDDADAAMSQLASLVQHGDEHATSSASAPRRGRRGKRARPPSAIAAILAKAGVAYTHENSEVVGSSRIEDSLSRRAEEAAEQAARLGERVFAASQVGSGSDVEVEAGGVAVYADGDGEGDGDAGLRKTRKRHRPPDDVRARQFCSMARALGYGSATEFALVVEAMSQAERRACLELFYRRRWAEEDGGGKEEDASL